MISSPLSVIMITRIKASVGDKTMYEFFGDTLNQIIENYSESKNTLIQKTGIDRSTFFQILKGKRIPTPDQLQTILDFLLLPPTEEMRLREAFLHDRLGDEGYKSRKTVLGLLSILQEDDNHTPSTPPVIYSPESDSFPYEGTTTLTNATVLKAFLFSALKKAQLEKENRIDLFLPLNVLRELDFYQMEGSLCANPEYKNRHFRHVLSFSSRTDPYTEEMFLDYREYIRFLISYPQVFQSFYYYDMANMRDSLGVVFPYYVIFPFGVLMINTESTEGLYSPDPLILEEYHHHFEKGLARMKPMITNIQSLEEYVPFQLNLPDETRTWYISWQPGISYLANDQMIEKFIPDKETQILYQTHIRAFQHTDYHEYISPDGLQQFLRSGRLKELHMDISAAPGDMEYAKMLIAKRLGENLDLVNPEHFNMPRNWAIHVVSGRVVSFVPLLHGNRAIFIHERKLAECFETFFDHLNEGGLLLDKEEACRFIH